MICVDASVAVKWFFVEEYSDQARSMLQAALESNEPLVEPPLLLSEVTNVVWQKVRRGQVSLEHAQGLLERFLSLPLLIESPPPLYERALVLADRCDLAAAYDAHYLALAETLGATFWTADARLVRALNGRLPFLRWIGDYP